MTVPNLLSQACNDLQDLAVALSDHGVVVAPPPNSLTPTLVQMPFVIAYPDTGELDMLATGSKNVHSINWEVHVSPNLLPEALSKAMDLLHLMDISLKQNPKLGGGGIQTVVFPLTYYFGRLDWGGSQARHIGARIVVRVKTEQALST